MMLEYYNMPDKTLETYRNLWFHTGDLGRKDEDGYFYFVDRKKDALRRRGENISSFEVERAINTHPKVLESAAVAVKSELAEDEVKICVVLKPGETPHAGGADRVRQREDALLRGAPVRGVHGGPAEDADGTGAEIPAQAGGRDA